MICLVQTWSQNYRPHHCVVRVGFVVTAFQRQAVPACTGSSVTPSGRDLAELRSRNVTEERLKITDTVILASHDDPRTAAQHLRRHLNLTQDSFKKMENKNKRNEISPHHIHAQKRTMPTGHNQQRRNTDCRVTKYLGMHLDHKLSWRDHIVMKRKQIELIVKELYWLLGRKSQLSIQNKLLIYKEL
jgi:hypothetical protein